MSVTKKLYKVKVSTETRERYDTTRNRWRVDSVKQKEELEEAIKGYLEKDRCALDAEKKENIELLKISNSFKRAASEKETKLEAVMALKKCLDDKRDSSQNCL